MAFSHRHVTKCSVLPSDIPVLINNRHSFTFTFSIGVLTARVQRLLPASERRRERKRISFVVTRLLLTLVGRKYLSPEKDETHRTVMDISTVQLLNSSQRLRLMAASLRYGLVSNMLMGIIFAVTEGVVGDDSRSQFTSVIVFLVWQSVMGKVPMVGVEGLTILKPTKVFVALTKHHGDSNIDTADIAKDLDDDESSVGTLTS